MPTPSKTKLARTSMPGLDRNRGDRCQIASAIIHADAGLCGAGFGAVRWPTPHALSIEGRRRPVRG
jgi:hypothetical protein